MVRRDRNHACVIMYSTGNEVPERDGHSDGNHIARELAEYFRQLDPSRPVTNALCNVSAQGDANGLAANLLRDQDYFLAATMAYAQPLDIVGYNYMRDRLEKDHEILPERIICASETVGSDIFHGWEAVEKFPWVIGDFLWTAVDYLGEVGVGRTEVDVKPLGLAEYPYRLSGCGDLDVACRKKPRSFYRDCVWGIAKRPYIAEEDPALHDRMVYPMWWGWPIVHEYWNYPGWEGKPVRITVYSMAEEVSLAVNGREIGRARAGKEYEYKARFTTSYQPGAVTCTEYIGGKAVGSHAISTPGQERMLCLTPDHPFLHSQEDDLVFVDVQLTDEKGLPVMEDGRVVSFEVQGDAEFMGAGSCAIKTTANYSKPEQPMENGYVQAVLRVKPQGKGRAVLICRSEGLKDAVLTLEIR